MHYTVCSTHDNAVFLSLHIIIQGTLHSSLLALELILVVPISDAISEDSIP